MVLSTFVGSMHFLGWYLDQKKPVRWDAIAAFLKNDVIISVWATFWTLFAILYFCYIRKSQATLEYERALRGGGKENQAPS